MQDTSFWSPIKHYVLVIARARQAPLSYPMLYVMIGCLIFCTPSTQACTHITFCIASNITQTRLFKYIENFTTKNWKFSDKNSDIFHISAQNIDCGYSLEPPRRGDSNEYPQSMFWAEIKKIMYTPVNPSFTI